MPISLQEAKAKVTDPVDIYKELRASERDDYLDLPNGAIMVRYRIVAGTSLDADYKALLDTATGGMRALPEDDETPEATAARLADELAARAAQTLCETVVEWDVSEVEGGPIIPLDPDAIRKSGMTAAVLQDILNGIAAHRKPGKNGRRR